MNKLFKIISIFFLITCLFSITSCYDQFNKTTYTVLFKDYDGTLLKEEEVEKNNAATPPTDPTREGYIFKGWDSEYTNITSDLTIIALYEKVINKYKVTFQTNSETNIEEEYYEKGDKIKEPTPPTKNGYTFQGWYLNDEKWSFIGYVVTEDITLNAKWQLNQYNITYDLNGGTASNPTTYTIEDEIALNNPTRTGYEFIGWITEENEIPKLNVSLINKTNDIHFIANWSNVYIV